jgi:hypothetical protein
MAHKHRWFWNEHAAGIMRDRHPTTNEPLTQRAFTAEAPRDAPPADLVALHAEWSEAMRSFLAVTAAEPRPIDILLNPWTQLQKAQTALLAWQPASLPVGTPDAPTVKPQ